MREKILEVLGDIKDDGALEAIYWFIISLLKRQ